MNEIQKIKPKKSKSKEQVVVVCLQLELSRQIDSYDKKEIVCLRLTFHRRERRENEWREKRRMTTAAYYVKENEETQMKILMISACLTFDQKKKLSLFIYLLSWQ